MQIFDRPSPTPSSASARGRARIWVPPNLVRWVFAGLLFWNPGAALCSYAGTGLLVLALRLIVAVPAAPAAEQPQAVPAAEAAPAEANEQLPIAA